MDDLISRQEAIDAIRASASKYTGFMEMEMYTDDDAVEAIGNVPSAQRWIPCSDSLPAVGVDVLVCYKLGKIRYVSIGELLGDGEFHGYDDEYLSKEGRKRKAVAWMPLPEPYKGEVENDE